jgi:hypothetical protein
MKLRLYTPDNYICMIGKTIENALKRDCLREEV